MKPPHVSVLDGSTFIVSDTQGDVTADPDQVLGLFFRDMRHLSHWKLTLDGRDLDALSTDNEEYATASFFLVVPTGTVYENPTLSLIRHRVLGAGMREQLRLSNAGTKEVVVEVGLQFDADFADLFEVKDKLSKKGDRYHRLEDGVVVLGYRREDFVRETWLHADGARLSDRSLTYHVRLAPAQTWSCEIDITLVAERPSAHRPHTHPVHVSHPKRHELPMEDDTQQWVDAAPTLSADWDELRLCYDRSILDLAALRLHPDDATGDVMLPAAGLPWFMAVFGRDSIITSYQALPFVPELARTTLQTLARRQATTKDDFRDAEPGKILHELRFGEMTYFKERPQSPYYGSADSTSLFLILLEEYERWTGDRDCVRELEPNARAALDWLGNYADLDGDGYVEYETRNPETGLVNQCWKDSWNSIVQPDGTLTPLPRGTCELQGYAYDARIRSARLAREVWDDEDLAKRLEGQAADLRRRFDEDFWVEDGAFFALALDGDKQRVPTLTSNMGQLLWSGIVEEHRVDDLVARLMDDRMFSGWGVRTLATGQGAFNPIEYHNGTVWPHDNALIAAGLARYGRHEEAGRIAVAVLEAARHFQHRLPEVFAGFPRDLTSFPVEYPTACSPQAWA
ncbi:MAG: glycogen debranching N-terminal domain-containing protein, partial [Actinomycetes bacterium]